MYGFNDDKSKSEFVFLTDTGSLQFTAGKQMKQYNVFLESDYGYTRDEYAIVGVSEFKSSNNVVFLTSFHENTSGSWELRFVVINNADVATTTNIEVKLTLVKK